MCMCCKSARDPVGKYSCANIALNIASNNCVQSSAKGKETLPRSYRNFHSKDKFLESIFDNPNVI